MKETQVHEKERVRKEGVTSDLSEFIGKLREKVSQDEKNREQWIEKIIAASNQRQGIKRVSNYPYEGAPDIPLPETDKAINKSTPNLVLSVWKSKDLARVQAKPTIQVDQYIMQQIKGSQSGLNCILRNYCDLYEKLELAADYAKEKGQAIFKVVEEFNERVIHKMERLEDYGDDIIERLKQLDNEQLRDFVAKRYSLDIDDDDDLEVIKDVVEQFRSGEEVIEFDKTEVESFPNIEVPSPEDIIVPDYTTDLNEAERITEVSYVTRHVLEDRMDSGMYEKKDLDEIELKKVSDDRLTTYNKRMQEGTQGNSEDLYKILDVYSWYKNPETDRWEKWIFTFLDEVSDTETAHLRSIPFPFEFRGWNFWRYDNEKRDPRHYNARGIPEKIRALQDTMEKALNNMLIRDAYNNSPIYEVLGTSELLDRDFTFSPGEMLPVNQLGSEVRRLDDGRGPDVSSSLILQYSKGTVEEYLGLTDQLFNNATNAGGGKTLGEVQSGMQQSMPLQDKDMARWNNVLSKVFKACFDIMRERAGESIYYEGIQITKEMFNFPAIVRCNGQLELSDARLSTQKAWMRLQAAMQMLQVGVATVEDVYEAYRDWLEKDGVKDPDQFSTNPAEIMQNNLVQMQQQLMQIGKQQQMITEQVGDSQKELAKNKKKMSEAVKEFEGEMEAIREG